jgi:hypothetical protein
MSVSLSDVRTRAGLGDYTGELRWTTAVQVTDRASGPGADEPGTAVQAAFPVTVACSATSDPAIGATCSLASTFDAVVPGAIDEVKRSVWQLGEVEVYDGGSDGLAVTEPNGVFARPGLFVP